MASFCITLCLLVLSFNSIAQKPSSVNATEQYVVSLVDLPGNLEIISKLNSWSGCPSIAKDYGSFETVCINPQTKSLNKSKKLPDRLVYKATDAAQIPDGIKNIIPLPCEPVSEQHPLYISIALDNDNVLLGLIPSGNDKGYTHGVILDVGGTDKKGVTWGGSLFTGLYTKDVILYNTATGGVIEGISQPNGYLIDGIFYERIYGDDLHYVRNRQRIEDEEARQLAAQKGVPFAKYAYDANGKLWEIPNSNSAGPAGKVSNRFKEETIFKVFANNNVQGKWYLWSVEAGFAYLNSQKVNDLLASGIQKGWHKFLDNMSKEGVVQYNYFPDQTDKKMAVILKASVGVQKDLFKSKTCAVNISSKIGYKAGFSGEPSYAFAHIATQLQLNGNKHPEKNLILGAGINVQKTKKDFGGDVTLGASYQAKKIKYFTTFQIPFCSPFPGAPSPYQDRDLIQRFGAIIPLSN